MNWRKRYTHHRNLLSRGHTEIGLVYGTLQMAILIWLFLRDLMSFSRTWIFIIAPIVAIIAILIQYLIGLFMDRTHLIDDIQEWDAQRNPLFKKIEEQTKK